MEIQWNKKSKNYTSIEKQAQKKESIPSKNRNTKPKADKRLRFKGAVAGPPPDPPLARGSGGDNIYLARRLGRVSAFEQNKEINLG